MDIQFRTSNIYLSEDILYTEIFPRLPAKDVGKCRCLSKEWHTKLSSSQFIYMHLERQENNILIATLEGEENNECTMAFRTTVNSLHWGRTEPLIAIEKHFIHSTCNGLVLLLDVGSEKMFSLMNPITRHHLSIPNSPERVALPALGYDTCSMDYKIVYPHFSDNLSVYVCSVKMGIWKKCDSSLYRGAIRKPYVRTLVRRHPATVMNLLHKTVVLNGVFYWILPVTINHTDTSLPQRRQQPKKYVLFTFDLAGEVFGEISLPCPTRFIQGPFVLGECLCTMHIRDQSDGVDLWVMKKCGDNNSWMKLATWPLEEFKGTPRHEHLPFHLVKPRYDEPLCLIDEGQKLLVRNLFSDRFSVYNLKEKNAINAIDDGRIGFGSFPMARTFVESLVSPIPADIVN